MADSPPSSSVPAPVEQAPAYKRALVWAFGRSYRTTLAGWASVVIGGLLVADNAMPNTIPHKLVAVATALVPVIGGAGLMIAKDNRVSGLPK